MITTLLWKDFRVNRTILLGNAICVVGIYLIAAISLASSTHQVRLTEWFDVFASSAVGCIILTCALAAPYGGTAFAQERHERSANFLAMLPVRRGPIIISKLLAIALALFGMILINAIVLLVCAFFVVHDDRYHVPIPYYTWLNFGREILVGGAITLMLFGVGWLLSTVLKSASLAALLSIGVTMAINLLILLMISRADVGPATQQDLSQIFCMGISFAIGLASFIFGTIYYLRRIEP